MDTSQLANYSAVAPLRHKSIPTKNSNYRTRSLPKKTNKHWFRKCFLRNNWNSPSLVWRPVSVAKDPTPAINLGIALAESVPPFVAHNYRRRSSSHEHQVRRKCAPVDLQPFASQSHSKASRSMCTSIKQTFKTHLRFLGPGLVASLFPRLPLFVGVLLTSMDVFVVLAFFSSYPDVSNKNRKSMHMFEVFVSFLIFVVISFFIILLVSVKPEWGKTFEGFIPNRRMIVNGGLYVSVSLIGATVMPHSIFLGSKVAIPERSVPEQFISIENPLDIDSQGGSEQEATVISLERTKRHLAHASFDIVASLLTLALPVNASILIVASATFFYGSDPSVKKNESLDLQSAYELLGSQVGPIAGYLFAIALLIAGQAASITVTLAGQIVSEGFLEWRTRPVIRRLVTRMIGIVPSAVVAGASGLQGVDHLMVGSQVGLSLVLPFVLAPLIILTSDPKIMRVKGHDTDTVRIRPTEVRPDFELPEGIENYHQSSKPHVKEEAPEYSTVCFANGRM
ncbi:hypothetical protein PCASD_10585 [Puccinia coronata f. sp. avenae]|uniref:Manganese transporter n=1 Tax=Puccinia coronata f. sp. avenae TaxID=200324 RepID=A0A2N5UKP4_9BASI|nr:hypothetical protein PCASD_10585 [Puccinia coronata f. sp. avenae]